jgi:hypothetical protein
MKKEDEVCVNDVDGLGEYLSKQGIEIPSDNTPESDAAKVVKRLLKELDSWDGSSVSDRLGDEIGMDELDILEFLLKLEEEIDIQIEESLFLSEQNETGDYSDDEEDDDEEDDDEEDDDDVFDVESYADSTVSDTCSTPSPTVGEVIAYVEWLAKNKN